MRVFTISMEFQNSIFQVIFGYGNTEYPLKILPYKTKASSLFQSRYRLKDNQTPSCPAV